MCAPLCNSGLHIKMLADEHLANIDDNTYEPLVSEAV